MSYGPLTAEQAGILRARWLSEQEAKQIQCLHDACPKCNGTGVKKDGLGLCFHAISCPCPKCNFTC